VITAPVEVSISVREPVTALGFGLLALGDEDAACLFDRRRELHVAESPRGEPLAV
jgi:hypothetical protein